MKDAWFMVFSVCTALVLVFVFTNPEISGMGHVSHMDYPAFGGESLPWFHGESCEIKQSGEIYVNGLMFVPAEGRYCLSSQLCDVECIKNVLNVLVIGSC